MSQGQHYEFAHRRLPEAFFADPDGMRSLLQSGNVAALRQFWDTCQEGKARSSEGLSGDWIERQGLTLGLVTLPTPQAPPEAHFAALIFEPQPYRYLVLEKTMDGGTILGEWNPRRNYGQGPPAQADSFVLAVQDLLQNPPEMVEARLDPAEFQLQAEDLPRYLKATPATPLKISPVKMALCQCVFLALACEDWWPRAYQAAGASWWSFRFKKKTRHNLASLVMALLYPAVQARQPDKTPALVMSTFMLCEYWFPLGKPSLEWSVHQEIITPQLVAQFLAQQLGRPKRVPTLLPLFLEHQRLIEERVQSVELI